MIYNANPKYSAGMLRAEVEMSRGVALGSEGGTVEFLVLINPGDNPLITLLQLAKLHAAQPWQGADVMVGSVPDESTRYVAFTYTGSPDSFWEGLLRVTEAVVMDAEEVEDPRLPGERSFARMLYAHGLPQLAQLPPLRFDGDRAGEGNVIIDPAWDELM